VNARELHPFAVDGRISRGPKPGHPAYDVAVRLYTPVLALRAGRVMRVWSSRAGGIGIWVRSKGPDGNGGVQALADQYYHLSGPLVLPGMVVAAGQKIGLSGSTGHSTGPHVHYETQVGGMRGAHVDPFSLGAFSRPEVSRSVSESPSESPGSSPPLQSSASSESLPVIVKRPVRRVTRPKKKKE